MLLTLPFASALSFISIQFTSFSRAGWRVDCFALAVVWSQISAVFTFTIELPNTLTPNFLITVRTFLFPNTYGILRIKVCIIRACWCDPDLTYAKIKIEVVAWVTLWMDNILAFTETLGIHYFVAIGAS